MLNKNKKKVLFVGSFKKTSKDGGVGGQMFACKTILNSNLSDDIAWTLVDSTADSNILPSTLQRVKKAFLRLLKFMYYVIFFKHHHILIFVADGWSFWEKGLMAIIGKFCSNSKVIIAPRSGFIINDINKDNSLSRFIKFVFEKVDVVICQSNYWRNLFEKVSDQVGNNKFIIIENSIDFETYNKLPLKNISSNEQVTILFMAWVTRSKGIFELIEAVKLLKDENLNFKVIVAGKGSDFEPVKELINQYQLMDVVALKGWLLGDEKMEVLKDADIFVLPTYFEGYPNSLIEAMASGKACISTRVGAIPDIIDTMNTGILIEKENVAELYNALKLLIQNNKLLKEMSFKARKHVLETNEINIGISKFKTLLK